VNLIDANILLYAYDSSAERHERARTWLEGTLSGTEPVGLAWVTILAFMRISTNPRVFDNPLPIGEAISIVSEWLRQPVVLIINPGERYYHESNISPRAGEWAACDGRSPRSTCH
jgi:uncharacterized protein